MLFWALRYCGEHRGRVGRGQERSLGRAGGSPGQIDRRGGVDEAVGLIGQREGKAGAASGVGGVPAPAGPSPSSAPRAGSASAPAEAGNWDRRGRPAAPSSFTAGAGAAAELVFEPAGETEAAVPESRALSRRRRPRRPAHTRARPRSARAGSGPRPLVPPARPSPMRRLLDDPEYPSHPRVDATEERVRARRQVGRRTPVQATHARNAPHPARRSQMRISPLASG